MSKISNVIEEFIKTLLEESKDESLEIKRNELAEYFNCAPSQINYVLKTRFNSSSGYYIESRRGGGGYIKILKVNINNNKYIGNLINDVIGDSITKISAYNIIDDCEKKDIISKREAMLMKTALSDRSLSVVSDVKNRLRANLLKDMILVILEK